MFVVLWEFEVKPGCENRFERVYGVNGEWAALFRSDAFYRETRLLRDASRALVYVTMDAWDSREAFDEFLRARKEEYKTLDAACEGLTAMERRIGAYEEIV
jgi:heme-degrading monooxygenase HmoA